MPREDVAGAVKQLILEGKVKHFGLSEASAQNIRKAHAVQPVTAIKDHYSLLMREPGTTKFSACEELGIGLVAWGPLGQGFLAGKITKEMKFDDPNDLRKDFPRFTPEALGANIEVVDCLKERRRAKRSRWPGCCPKNLGSCRFRVAQKLSTWITTCRPPMSG